MYDLQRILSELLLPPFGPSIGLFLACLIAVRKPRLGISIGAACLVLQLGLGLASANRLLVGELPPIPDSVRPPYPEAEAIVVLGSGRHMNAPEWGGETASAGTLERVRYAAKLHRETGLPILVSGGKPGDTGMRSEAEHMRGILEDEFGVPVKWIEDASQDTQQNGRFSARILRDSGVGRILLVTHGGHMQRAQAMFEQEGMAVVPMITGFRQPEHINRYGLTPSFYGMAINRYAVYELLAKFKPG